ncbi:hypothetical protein HNR44_000069 [Geomicrobium halophilum]|uniref:Uncharacterized protein n=1 Tax=Geomicrobium halophilum TaxID=549000 RepID=A0A841PH56_9BACL|nr:hypothetical protein [Geomicrobium halophilum]MBB6448120.1 hypothetical protein [Geomicrobium halophilum]
MYTRKTAAVISFALHSTTIRLTHAMSGLPPKKRKEASNAEAALLGQPLVKPNT